MDNRVRSFLASAVALLFVAGLFGVRTVSPAPSVALSAADAPGGVSDLPQTDEPLVDTTLPLPTIPTVTTITLLLPRHPTVTTTLTPRPVKSGRVEIHGVVRDASNAPVPDACITVWLAGPSGPPKFERRTGTDGAFTGGFDMDYSADWTTIEVVDCSGAMPGFARQDIQLMTSPGNDYDVPVVAKPGSALQGRLFDEGGTALGGVCVIISMNPINSYGVVTDSNGAWTLKGAPQGRFGLSARGPESGKCALALGTDYRPKYLVAPDAVGDTDPSGDITAPGVFGEYKLYVARPS
jgi:hypothetical protein